MNNNTLRRQASGLLTGYGIQFLLGMALNLFVSLPTTHPGTVGSNYFARSGQSLMWALMNKGGWALTVHATLALLLALGSIGLFVSALRRDGRGWQVASGIAALLTVGALFNGLSFLNYNENVSSMIMAVGWLGAVTALSFALARYPAPAASAPTATR